MEKANETKAVTMQEKNITDTVLARVKQLEQEGNIQFPPHYSYANALKSAYLILQETVDKDKKPVLTTCTKASISNALLDMVIQGLSPAKKQCYFVAYGGKLTLMRSYMGTVAATKRLKSVKNVVANIIYDGDEFEYIINRDTGEKEIVKHTQKFEDINNDKIKGAYAIVVTEEGVPNHVEIMNINQIKKAWGMSRQYTADSKVHNNFAEEMAKKTVINRACKMYINTSDDSDILIESINRTEEKEYDEKDIVDDVQYEVKEEIRENGAKKGIDIDDEQPGNAVPVVDAEIIQNDTEQQSMTGPGF